jgi:hypothetical protein
MDDPPERFRNKHGFGRCGLGQRVVEVPPTSRATIWAANPERLHGFCPCGEQPGAGKHTVDLAAMSRMVTKLLSIMQSPNVN